MSEISKSAMIKAIIAIIIIAIIAEISPRVGWWLAGLAGLAMVAVYFNKRK